MDSMASHSRRHAERAAAKKSRQEGQAGIHERKPRKRNAASWRTNDGLSACKENTFLCVPVWSSEISWPILEGLCSTDSRKLHQARSWMRPGAFTENVDSGVSTKAAQMQHATLDTCRDLSFSFFVAFFFCQRMLLQSRHFEVLARCCSRNPSAALEAGTT